MGLDWLYHRPPFRYLLIQSCILSPGALFFAQYLAASANLCLHSLLVLVVLLVFLLVDTFTTQNTYV